MQHDPFPPAFIVDVSAVWEVKQRALDAYESQLHQPEKGDQPSASGGVATKVSSPEFRQAVAGRAQHFGLMVGAAYGEPFWSSLPLAVRDPLAILPGGPR
jgi:LmbE family N-acetylglucosaminyl deacetylase